MSLTPTTPDFRSVAKSFWARPEGKTGMLFLGALGLGVGGVLLFYWGLILPFLIGVAGNTIQLAALVGILAVLTSPLWSRRVKFLTQLAFQQSMRWATSWFVQIDPIGILRENIKQIREQVAEFSKAVAAIAGNRQRVIDDIAKQKAGIRKNANLSKSAEIEMQKLESAKEHMTDSQQIQEQELSINRISLARQGYGRIASAQLQALKREQPALESLNKLYDQLCRIRDLGTYRAEALSQEADIESQTHDLMANVKSAIRSGSKMLQRDPNQTAVYEQAIEYLNNDASDTLGAMSDFNRWAERSLTDMDIQNGAQAQEAFQMFAEMEKKLKAPVAAARVIQVSAQPAQAAQQLTAQSQGTEALARAVAATPDARPQEMEMPDFDSPEIQKLLK